MYTLTLPQHFVNLREVSDAVEDYISRQTYILEYGPDDYTAGSILSTCYEIIYEELNEYGIVVDTDWRNDWFTCGYIYLLRKFVDDLPQLIRPVKDDIENYLNSSEITDELNDIYEIVQPSGDFKELPYILSSTYTTDNKFLEYVKSIIANLNDETVPVKIPNIEQAKEYIIKTGKLRELATKYSRILINNLTDLTIDVNVVNKMLRDYDVDKISPELISIYSKVDTDEVPEYLSDLKDKYMQEHHERAPHHIEYYTDPKKSPLPLVTVEALILMVAHHVEIGTTKAEFAEAVEDMIVKGRSVLREDKISLIRRMKDIILLNMEDSK